VDLDRVDRAADDLVDRDLGNFDPLQRRHRMRVEAVGVARARDVERPLRPLATRRERIDMDVAAAVVGGVALPDTTPYNTHTAPHDTFRQRATAAIHAQLRPARVSELHAQGAVLTQYDAVAYALDAIASVLRDEAPESSGGRDDPT
jgi:hypothetical protein